MSVKFYFYLLNFGFTVYSTTVPRPQILAKKVFLTFPNAYFITRWSHKKAEGEQKLQLETKLDRQLRGWIQSECSRSEARVERYGGKVPQGDGHEREHGQ